MVSAASDLTFASGKNIVTQKTRLGSRIHAFPYGKVRSNHRSWNCWIHFLCPTWLTGIGLSLVSFIRLWLWIVKSPLSLSSLPAIEPRKSYRYWSCLFAGVWFICFFKCWFDSANFCSRISPWNSLVENSSSMPGTTGRETTTSAASSTDVEFYCSRIKDSFWLMIPQTFRLPWLMIMKRTFPFIDRKML